MDQISVLCIEDNPENRLLVKRTLEAEGCIVIEAVDGPSGLRAARESQPDVILLDISLPGIDGYDLARRFANWAHLDKVPVLAITANVMKGDRERALGAGCDGYIPKPINIDRLPGQIEEALQRAGQGRRRPRAAPAELPSTSPELDELLALLQEDGDRQGLSEFDWSNLFETGAGGESDAGGNRLETKIAAIGAKPESEAGDELAGDSVDRLSAEGEVGPGRLEAVDQPALTVVDAAEAFEEAGPELGEPGAEGPDHGLVLSLARESETEVREEMRRLSDELGAEAVILMGEGQVLVSVGRIDVGKREQLAGIVSQALRGSDGVAVLLGCKQGSREQITDVGDFLLHALELDGNLVILTVVPRSVPLGATRLWTKRSAARVKDVVHEKS